MSAWAWPGTIKKPRRLLMRSHNVLLPVTFCICFLQNFLQLLSANLGLRSAQPHSYALICISSVYALIATRFLSCALIFLAFFLNSFSQPFCFLKLNLELCRFKPLLNINY